MLRRNKRKLKNVIFKTDFTKEDLYKAYWDCRKRKRSTDSCLEFEIFLESNMLKLYEELKTGRYEIGKSICFVVLQPKPREIWAASFRDRIVHHLIYNAVYERFYNHFINETFSCIPKRGTLKAGIKIQRFAQAITQNYTKKAYYLKVDIKNFFVSIDKHILYELIIDRVPEKWLQKLIYQVLFNDPRNGAIVQSPDWKFKRLPKEKSLWNTPNDKGLPIGNLTSQFFSNVYLDKLDQFVKHKLRCKYYCRYVDDFIILDESPQRLNYCYDEIAKFVKENLALELHKNKKSLNLISNGMDFVGYKIKPHRIFLRQKTINKMFHAAKLFTDAKADLKIDEIEKYYATFNSYLGQLRSVNGYNLRKKLCDIVAFPEFSIGEDYTKVQKEYLSKSELKYIKMLETKELPF